MRVKEFVHWFWVLFGGPVNCGVCPRSTVTPKPLPPPCASSVARLVVSAASFRCAGFGPFTSNVATSNGEQVARRGSVLLMHNRDRNVQLLLFRSGSASQDGSPS